VRIAHLARQDIQRIGLSATIGNPQQLIDWLCAESKSPRRVINPPSPDDIEPDVQLDYVGSLPNAALVISRLHRGEKRLVFCDSRARVEELAVELCQRGVDTLVSHSSLSHGADMICIATACAKRASNTRLLAQALSKSSDFLICAECKS
jgi:ATP-dependent helicase Lhr and Lhr-like helicase